MSSLGGDFLDLLACAEVGSLLSLVIGVDVDDSLFVLQSLLGSSGLSLLSSLSLFNLWCLVSDLTSTSHGSVHFANTSVNNHRSTYPYLLLLLNNI